MDEGHVSHHLLYLVGLKVADEVDLSPSIGVRPQVGSQFLYPVFSAQPDTRGNCGADGLVRLYLGSGA